MARVEANLQHLPRDPVSPLYRLVGIGIGAHRDRARAIGGLGQRRAQQIGRRGLGEQLRFEIQPRRQVVVSMGRPREAIDAAMFASAIGVDRAVEGNVGRAVEAEDRLRVLLGHGCPQLDRRPVERFDMIAPVAIGLARGQAEPGRGGAGLGTAAAHFWFEASLHDSWNI